MQGLFDKKINSAGHQCRGSIPHPDSLTYCVERGFFQVCVVGAAAEEVGPGGAGRLAGHQRQRTGVLAAAHTFLDGTMQQQSVMQRGHVDHIGAICHARQGGSHRR